MMQSILKRLQSPRLWRAGGLLMLANVIVTGLGLARTPLMTWMLPKEEIGMLGVVASWLPFLQLISMSGMDSASYHYIAKGQPAAFLVNLKQRLRWSVLSSLGFLGGAGYWAWQGQPALAGLFIVAGLSYPLTIGLSGAAGMIAARENFTQLFWYRIWESLTDFAGFIPLLLSTWWISQVWTFYTANQLATALMMVGYSLVLLQSLRRESAMKMSADDEAEMARYGRHLTAINAISVAQNRSDALLVGLFTPLNTAADYSIANLVQEQIRRLWNIYITLRYPPLVRMPLYRRWKRFLLEGALIWLGFIFTGLLVAFLAYWLIPWLLPASYTASLGYIYLLIAAVTATIPGGLAELYFRTIQNEQRQYQIRILSAICGVLFPAALVFVWAGYGAALGRLLANIVFSIMGVIFFLNERKAILANGA